MCGDCTFDLQGNKLTEACSCSQGGDPNTALNKCGCDTSQDYPMNCFFCQHAYTTGSGTTGGAASGSGGGSGGSGGGSGSSGSGGGGGS